jgi:hypothetical protein
VGGRESINKGEKSRKAEEYEGAVEAEEIRDIKGRLRASECARTFVA